MSQEITTTIGRARQGDKAALEELIRSIQGLVYNLALRFLQRVEDAQDASQEILVKVANRLADFRGESAFTTWVYRLSVNYLLNLRRRGAQPSHLSFEELGQTLQISLQAAALRPVEESYEDSLLAEEVKRSCTLGMLMGLEPEQRLALILGDILQVNGEEAAQILEITPAAFRKRLSRARRALVAFVSSNCGIINPEKPCRCHKHVHNAIQAGKLDPGKLRYASYPASGLAQAVALHNTETSRLRQALALLRSHPNYPFPWPDEVRPQG